MSSTSEKGHAKNVANFADLVSICAGFGAKYNPSRKELELLAITKLSTDAEQAQTKLNNSIPAYTTAVATKDVEFKALSKLVTRVMGALRSSKPLAGELSNAETIAGKIRGTGKKKKAVQDGKEAISTAQLSMDMRIENLNRLTEVVAANTMYAPNETELQAASLTTFAAKLKALSEAVVKEEIPVNDARDGRNQMLYAADMGLVTIAGDIKQYVKSAFGATSPQYKRVSAIRFSK